jgi:ABC-type transport system involved in multi-copper enzyme maturation permease subunit
MPNASHAFGGIWRLTIKRSFTPMHWLAMAGMLVVLALFSFPMAPTRGGAPHGFLSWATGFYLCFLVPILAFISAANSIRDDLGAGTTDYVLTRPVRRPAFVLFRFIAHLSCAQLDFLLALGVVIGVGFFRDVPGLWTALPRLLLAQVLVVTAFSGFGFLSGVLTSRYIIIGLVYGGIIEVGIGNVPTQLNRISMVRHVIGIMQPMLGGERIGMGGPLRADALPPGASAFVLLGFSAVMIAAATAIFSVRELAGPTAREG